MKRILMTAATSLLLAACQSEVSNFRAGVPQSQMVQVKVPEAAGASNSMAPTGNLQSALRGDHSGFYDVTRGATVIVNSGVGAVLDLLKKITSYQPTSLNGTTAVWGPGSDALSPNTWKLTVTRTAPDTYSYKFEAKAKTAPDSAYVTVLSGDHQAGSGQDVGSGSFLLDWDKAQTLPEHDANVGTAKITYSRTDAGVAAVSVHFTQVKDGQSGNLIDADYAYSATHGAGGSFEFSTLKNIDDKPASEHLTIKSRWQETGAGRADVKATGGDLSGPATINECWDTNFTSRFLNLSYNSNYSGYGAESTDCAFAHADYSKL